MARLGGVTTVIVAAGTAACGLLMLSGFGPSASGGQIVGDSVPTAPAIEITTTTTTTSTTTTTTVPPAPSPVPLSVTPNSVTVGLGGTARISGTCPATEAGPLGPVQIWQIGHSITVIQTGVTAAEWSYDWTAPTVADSLVLQAWCGDPSGFTGGYPAALQVEVVFVAQEQPVPTTTTTVAGRAAGAIPETG